jgi:hypothetical protein
MNQAAIVINIVKCYGCINEPTLKITCKPFCHPGRLHAQARVTQNNHMMAQCLKKSVTVASLTCLEPYQSQYMFNNGKYAPLMYKIIMHLATIDIVATTEALCSNLSSFLIYAMSIISDIDLISSYFDVNYS